MRNQNVIFSSDLVSAPRRLCASNNLRCFTGKLGWNQEQAPRSEVRTLSRAAAYTLDLLVAGVMIKAGLEYSGIFLGALCGLARNNPDSFQLGLGRRSKMACLERVESS